MNLIDAWVTEVIGEPYYDDYGSGNYKWWLDVAYEDIGGTGATTLMFNTKEEAKAVTPGYKFLY